MKKIKYTPDAAEKLRAINSSIRLRYDEKIAAAIMKKITGTIRDLTEFENLGSSVEKMFDVESDYHYIFVAKNYIFYRIENDYIKIINIYNEKEDFMWSLFGIDTISKETLDYWKE